MLKLIVGCGYLGLPLAHRWLRAGHQVHVTTRSQTRARQLAEAGFHPLVVDITQPEKIDFPAADCVVFAVGFDRERYQDIEQVYVAGLRNVVQQLPPPRRFIYISSTGVYGQSQAQWVDEQSECRPARPGGVACLKAEQLLGQLAWNRHVTILRLAGLYGPERVPRQQQILAGQPIPGAAGHINLIHVADAIQIVDITDSHREPAAVYNVADGHPVQRRDYYRYVAQLLNAPPPTFVPPAEDSPQASRAGSDKRVRTDRLVKQLQPQFQFPSHREGLAQILRQPIVKKRASDD